MKASQPSRSPSPQRYVSGSLPPPNGNASVDQSLGDSNDSPANGGFGDEPDFVDIEEEEDGEVSTLSTAFDLLNKSDSSSPSLLHSFPSSVASSISSYTMPTPPLPPPAPPPSLSSFYGIQSPREASPLSSSSDDSTPQEGDENKNLPLNSPSEISNLTSQATEHTAPLELELEYEPSTSSATRKYQDAADIIAAKSEILTDPLQSEHLTIFLPPPPPYNIFLFPSPLGIYVIPPESLSFCPVGWCLEKVCGKVIEGKSMTCIEVSILIAAAPICHLTLSPPPVLDRPPCPELNVLMNPSVHEPFCAYTGFPMSALRALQKHVIATWASGNNIDVPYDSQFFKNAVNKFIASPIIAHFTWKNIKPPAQISVPLFVARIHSPAYPRHAALIGRLYLCHITNDHYTSSEYLATMDGYKKYRIFTERECFEWLVTQCLPAYMASPEYEVTLKKTYSEEVGIHRPPLSVTNSASKKEHPPISSAVVDELLPHLISPTLRAATTTLFALALLEANVVIFTTKRREFVEDLIMHVIPTLVSPLQLQQLRLPWVKASIINDLSTVPGGCIIGFNSREKDWNGENGTLINFDTGQVKFGDGVEEHASICRSVKRLNFYYQNLKSTPQTLSFVNACNDVSLEFLGARAGKGRRWKIDGEWAVDERKVKGRGTQAFNIFWAQA
ncbi:hypothetical protein TrVE_jg6794 [Triparma verrucosa]|uniref:Uncharacterized protein n=1 Tax=Triparma verrucosa TaxID=1606542 RepID=A0A9W7BMM9_9STRA|nr:hypothetical protein TrVE_jg6794 [Triparma verrucosa]